MKARHTKDCMQGNRESLREERISYRVACQDEQSALAPTAAAQLASESLASPNTWEWAHTCTHMIIEPTPFPHQHCAVTGADEAISHYC